MCAIHLEHALLLACLQGGDTAWMTAVDDGQQKSELGACGLVQHSAAFSAGFSALAV